MFEKKDAAPPSGIFANFHMAMELSSTLSFKQKKAIKEAVTKNGGVISYIITKKVTHLLIDTKEKLESYKCRQARKLAIPIVSTDFVLQCAEAETVLDIKGFLLEKTIASQHFDKGKITVPKKEIKKHGAVFNPATVPSYSREDTDAPKFPDEFELAKWSILQKYDKRRGDTQYVVLEVHVVAGATKNTPGYRVSLVKGWQQDIENEMQPEEEQRFPKTADQAVAVFAWLCERLQMSPNHMTLGRLPPTCIMGSTPFIQIQMCQADAVADIGEDVAVLVQSLWQEAIGSLSQVLVMELRHIKLEQIDKAEAVLLKIREALTANSSTSEVEELTKEFYQNLPHSKDHRTPVNSVKAIAQKQDLCQVIRDVISVSESTNWSPTCSPVAMYKALRSHIYSLPQDSANYQKIKSQIQSSQLEGEKIEVHKVYKVSRGIEDDHFQHDIDNKQLLFHSSAVKNYVGILSRGLLLPKIVVDDFGGTRTDIGKLGSGIYFTDASSTSLKYSSPGQVRGSRLLSVHQVALGKCYDTTKEEHDFKSPPEGYNSVHGVRNTRNTPSDFKDDEYVVYETNQQCIQFLVEFTVAGDTIKDVPVAMDDPMDIVEEDMDVEEMVDVMDVHNIANPLDSVQAGLRTSQDTPIPLQSVHIRAKLVDLAAQVVVLQEYTNESDVPIEAKYVFPLDDMAAVCGFEIFINGKHIKGQVKEKEEARREYKEAISKGHGAYLMDEEKPDVFTISVGNLPSHTSALIKITYVAELQMDGDLIRFCIPGSVAPWDKDPSLAQVTQMDVDVVQVEDEQPETFSLQVAIEMPFDIRTVHSPSHDIKMKKTASTAVVELPRQAQLGKGFQLEVGLAEVHVPRMWVEKDTAADTRACMLTFYPEFDAETTQDVDVTILVDMSNSMKGATAQEAKKVALLALHQLPDGYRFNVVAFGTSHQELFPQVQPKTEANLEAARSFIHGLRPCLGNTDAWRPLHCCYLLPPEDRMSNIFLISDGHLNNEAGLLGIVRNNLATMRIFTMGIGSVANQHLLKSVALAGGGSYQFYDASRKSKWQGKIESQLVQAGQLGLSSVSVHWEQHRDDISDGDDVLQAPSLLTSLFSGARQVVYGFADNCTQATLQAEVAGTVVSTMVSTADLNIKEGNILHTLTARAIIRDWEDGMLDLDYTKNQVLKDTRKQEIIELSKKYSIVTKFTSFVAVEERHPGEEKDLSALKMEDLVADEDVDILNYMGFQVAPPEEKTPVEKFQILYESAKKAELISVLEAKRICDELVSLFPRVEKKLDETCKHEIGQFVRNMYKSQGVNEKLVETLETTWDLPVPIRVRTISGTYDLIIKKTMTAADLKQMLAQRLEQPVADIGLKFENEDLCGVAQLGSYNLAVVKDIKSKAQELLASAEAALLASGGVSADREYRALEAMEEDLLDSNLRSLRLQIGERLCDYYENVKMNKSYSQELRLRWIEKLMIHVRTLTGKSLSLYVQPSDTISTLKKALEKVEGSPTDQMRLIYEGKQLEDGYFISDYAMSSGSVLHLVMRLRGGGGPLSTEAENYSKIGSKGPTLKDASESNATSLLASSKPTPQSAAYASTSPTDDQFRSTIPVSSRSIQEQTARKMRSTSFRHSSSAKSKALSAPQSVIFGLTATQAAGIGSTSPESTVFGSARSHAEFGTAPPHAGLGSNTAKASECVPAIPQSDVLGSHSSLFGSSATTDLGSPVAPVPSFGSPAAPAFAFGSPAAPAAPPAAPPASGFGSNAPSAAEFGSLFGSTAVPSTLFGSPAAPAFSFGSQSTPAAPTSAGFGSAKQSGSLFGSPAAPITGFGSAYQPSAGFGSAMQHDSSFGAPTAMFGTSATTGTGFGSAAPPAAGFGSAKQHSSLFGSSASTLPSFGSQAAPAATTGTGFGSAAPPAAGFGSAKQHGSLFGSSVSTVPSFGSQAAPAAPTGTGFGSAAPPAAGFGSAKQHGSLFGSSASTVPSFESQAAPAATTGTGFGSAAPPAAGFGSAKQHGSLFGSSASTVPSFGSQAAPAATTGTGFGSAAPPAAGFGSAKQHGSLFGSSASTVPSFGSQAAPAATTGTGFGSAAPPAAGFGSAKPHGSLFGSSASTVPSFGSQAAPAATTGTGFGSAAPPAAGFGSAKQHGSLFGSSASTVPSFGSQAAPASTTGTGFGSSAPPAAGFGSAKQHGSLFGLSASTVPSFGSQAAPAATTGTGFGSADSRPAGFGSAAPPGAGFGSHKQYGSPFGAPAAVFGPTAPPDAGFGSTKQHGSLFGSLATPAVGFGSASPPGAGFGSPKQPGSLFGSPAAPAPGFGSATPPVAGYESTSPPGTGFGSAEQHSSLFGSNISQAAAFRSSAPQAFSLGFTIPQSAACMNMGTEHLSASGRIFGSAPKGSAFGSMQQQSAVSAKSGFFSSATTESGTDVDVETKPCTFFGSSKPQAPTSESVQKADTNRGFSFGAVTVHQTTTAEPMYQKSASAVSTAQPCSFYQQEIIRVATDGLAPLETTLVGSVLQPQQNTFGPIAFINSEEVEGIWDMAEEMSDDSDSEVSEKDWSNSSYSAVSSNENLFESYFTEVNGRGIQHQQEQSHKRSRGETTQLENEGRRIPNEKEKKHQQKQSRQRIGHKTTHLDKEGRFIPNEEEEKYADESTITVDKRKSAEVTGVWSRLLPKKIEIQVVQNLAEQLLNTDMNIDHEFLQPENLIKELQIDENAFVEFTRVVGLKSLGLTACEEISRLILIYLAMTLVGVFIGIQKTVLEAWYHNILGPQHGMQECAKKYPMWYRNLELGRTLEDVLDGMRSAVKSISCDV